MFDPRSNSRSKVGRRLRAVIPPSAPRLSPSEDRRRSGMMRDTILRRSPLFLLAVALLALAGTLLAVPAPLKAAPGANDPSVVWSATLTGHYCDYDYAEAVGGTGNDFKPGQDIGPITSHEATHRCTDHLSDTGFSDGGEDWEVLLIEAANASAGGIEANAQVWLDNDLISGQLSNAGFPADVHRERRTRLGPGIPYNVYSRLFFWYGDTALPVRDARHTIQIPFDLPDDSGKPDVEYSYRLYWSAPSLRVDPSGSVEMRLAIAPAEPANVVTVPGNRSLSVSWDASDGATRYEVHYKQADAPYEMSPGSDPATGWVDARHAGAATTTAIGGLANGTVYEVRVRALNPGGWSLWSYPGIWHSDFGPRDLGDGLLVGCRNSEPIPYSQVGNLCSSQVWKSWPDGWVYKTNIRDCDCAWWTNQWSPVAGALTDDGFTHGGTDYQIYSMHTHDRQSGDGLNEFTLGVSPRLAGMDGMRLHVEVRDHRHDHHAMSRVYESHRNYAFADATNRDTSGYDSSLGEDVEVTVQTWGGLSTGSEYTLTPERLFRADERMRVWLWDPAASTPAAASGTGESGGQSGSPGSEGGEGAVAQGQSQYAELIDKMYEWRNDPEWVSHKEHTDRWDRALLAFGENVADATLTRMTAAEAQGFADRGSAWSRWVEVAEALRDLEAAGQLEQTNQAPTVSTSISDVTIVNESGTRTVSLSGVFDDADGDGLTISARSSDEATATASVSSDGSSLTVTARLRGTATITVTADDGNSGTADDTFTVTVKAAPVLASALADVSGLEMWSTQDVSLIGVFSDADGDQLTIAAASSDETRATVTVASDGSELTLSGVAEGTTTVSVTARDSDGNRVSDAFQVEVVKRFASLIPQMYQWRNDPQWVSYKDHTDR